MNSLKTLAIGFALTIAAPSALAIDPPSKKARPTFASNVLDQRNTENVQLGLIAAKRGDWRQVRFYRNSVTDPTARKLLLWREASSGLDDANFDELNQALTDLRDWPAMGAVRENAEEKINDSRLSLSQKISWLETSGPQSGEGKLNLAGLYLSSNRRGDASRLIKDAWRNHTFSVSRQREIARQYSAYLTEDDHIARTKFLLWTSQRSAATAMKSYLPAAYDRLVEARIALAVGAQGVDGKINAVPAPLSQDAGLLFRRSNWRRKRGRWSDARPLLLELSPEGVPVAGLERIWEEKNLHIRRAIRDKEYGVAYDLASTHGLESGVDFANGEFIAGWMALRYLGRSADALRHFETLSNGVSSPISKSRGLFWKGEALTALNRRSEATIAYREAAKFNTTFYGQLAAERLGNAQIYLSPPVLVGQDKQAAFEARELVKAMVILLEAGELYQFRRISYHLDDQLRTPEDYAALFAFTQKYNLTQVGVRGAKAGLNQGIVEAGSAYPLFPFSLPDSRNHSAEPAMVIALSRQESELNAKAVSRANAYGLMQMLHPTARAQARKEGRPYRKSWLLDDPEYNARLGRDHLSDLVDRFDGSYILAIAGYNAGANRPARWIREYGDPRRGEIDPIDFIESIPFSETRNYVQRVLENTQVYRHRLSGQSEPIRLEQDLNRGR